MTPTSRGYNGRPEFHPIDLFVFFSLHPHTALACTTVTLWCNMHTPMLYHIDGDSPC